MAHELASVPCCWSSIRGTSALEGVLQAMTSWRNGCSRNHRFGSCTQLWNGFSFCSLRWFSLWYLGIFLPNHPQSVPLRRNQAIILSGVSACFGLNPVSSTGLILKGPSCDIRIDIYGYMDIRPYPYPYTFGHLYIYNIYIYIIIRIQRRYAYIQYML